MALKCQNVKIHMLGIGLGMFEVIIPQKSGISMKQIQREFRLVAAVISCWAYLPVSQPWQETATATLLNSLSII